MYHAYRYMPESDETQAEKMPSSIFSENLRAAIARSGLRQTELAAMVGCTQSDISRYLTRDRIPSGDKLVELARALGTTAERLITGRALAINVDEPDPAAEIGLPPRRVVNREAVRLAVRAEEALRALRAELERGEG